MALKFSDIQELYADGIGPETLTCIATPCGKRCHNLLEVNQLLNLRDLLQDATPQQMDKENVRDIINCLICVDHQRRNYRHKYNVQSVWAGEFPSLDFSTRRSQSPYSLSSGGSTPRRRSKRANSSISSTPVSTPNSSSNSDSVSLTPPLPRPNFDPPLERSISTPVVPLSEQLFAASNNSPAVFINHAVDYFQQEIPDSPLASRSQLRDLPRGPASSETNIGRTNQSSSQSPNDHPETMDGITVAPELGTQREQESLRPSNSQQEQARDGTDQEARAEQNDQARSGRFENGEAAAWAPWTIRQASLDLIRQPIPNPKARGSIYAVQVTNNERPVVKIGITYQDVNARLGQITREHQQSFDMHCKWHKSGIPALQLERLERLVHAELAFFQRNWLISTDRSHKTHHEYFEVDLKTAQETVDLCWNIVRTIGTKPDDTDPLIEAIGSDPDLSVCQASDTASTSTWNSINQDHSRRIKFLKKQWELRKHSPSSKSMKRALWWGCSSIAIWLLLGMSPQTWHVILAIMIPFSTWDLFV